jgi:NifU-like protein involved in Fe-S cluster formation
MPTRNESTVMATRAPPLYTPAILAAATGLAAWPWDEDLPLRGEARSRTCGSSMAIGFALDDQGCITHLGIRTHACAIGQAAAYAFAQAACGQTRAAIAETRDALGQWLTDAAPLPDWPGLSLIAPARAHPSRHGAIVLAWDAALAALPVNGPVNGPAQGSV